MNTVIVEGLVTALTPISHGDGRLGTTTKFRRAKVIQKHGDVVAVPMVSGNAVRGRLRRASADYFWAASGRPAWTPPAFRVLHQGGTLEKTATRMDSESVVSVRNLVPHLSVFGWAAVGQIPGGRSIVSGLTPVCAETAHLTGIESDVSMWEMIDRQEYSRMEDTVRAPRSRDQITGPVEFDESTQMRYGMELLAAGTPMTFSVSLTEPTPLEEAWTRAVLSAWAADGATVGGRSSAGFGRLDLSDLSGWQATDEDYALIADHHKKNADEIAEAVACLS